MTEDIKSAYMQFGHITLDVYVRPPLGSYLNRGIVLKLLNIPYGMTDAGRKWLLRVQDWMLRSAGMSRVDVVNQPFVKRNIDGIPLITAKDIDDFFNSGSASGGQRFPRGFGK